jgi:acyl-CoA synthetase (AMP-forming)/AMP-acid ligase II
MYTGGTTGMPKGVICEVAPWATGLTAIFAQHVLGITTPPQDVPQLVGLVKGLRAKGVVPVVMPSSPLMHTAGLANSLPFQMLGGRCVTLYNRSFDPLELWRTIARERVMCTVIVGDAFARPMLSALDEAKARGESLDLASLKIMISSGVIWSQGVKEELLKWLDATLIDGVGATEGPMALQISRRGQTGASARFVALAETRLFAEDGREIPKDSTEPGVPRCRRDTTRIRRRRRRRSASSTAGATRSSATGGSGIRMGRCSCWGAARPASTPAARRSIPRKSNT